MKLIKCLKILKKWGTTYSDRPFQKSVPVPLELVKIKYLLGSSIIIKSFYMLVSDDEFRGALLFSK